MVFLLSFFFLLSYLSFFLFLRLFLIFKSNTHTMCGTWSHLTKGLYKRISGQKYELLMYFKIWDFLKKYFVYVFDRNYKILYAPQNQTFGTEFMSRFLFLFELITYAWYFSYLFSFRLFLLFLRLFFYILKATYIPSMAHGVT